MLLDISSEHLQMLERFAVILYDKWSSSCSINETRKQLFCHENRAMDRLPPTKDALLQHVKRTIYQAGIWTTSTKDRPVDQRIRFMGASLDDNTRSVKGMQRTYEMQL